MSTENESTTGSEDAATDGLWLDYEIFASMVGFQAGLNTLDEKGEIKWTNTATHMRTGGIHGLRYKVEKDENNYPLILLQHWVHWPGGKVPSEEQKRRSPQILKFRTKTRSLPDGRLQVHPVDAEWMGKVYTDPVDLMKLMHFLQETSSEIRDNIAHNTTQTGFDAGTFSHLQRRIRQTKRRDEIPNLYDIAQRCDMKTATALQGMNYNGEFNFGEPVKSAAPPVYPVQLLRSMFAFEAEIVQNGIKPFARSHTVPDIGHGGYQGVTYSFSPANNSFGVMGKIWRTSKTGQMEEVALYNINFIVDDKDESLFRLVDLEMLGQKPDINDHKGVARAIRAMKYIHLAIQRGEAPQLSDIIHEHDLKSFLTGLKPPEATPESPRTMVQVFGANTDAVFSKKELSIGSNGFVIIRDFMKGGQWVKQAIGGDWGVTFGDPKDGGYSTITQNYGRYLTHPNSPHIKPYVDTFLNLETHEHEDHLRGIARVAKFGYTLPPMVMNKHTARVLYRMMGEEGVTKNKKKEVMDHCHIVEVTANLTPPDDFDPKAIKTFTYGDTVLEQGTEVIWSEAEQRNKYFPTITAYTKQHPEAKTFIRIGPAGHSAHSLMFDVEGVLYTGDYKLDQTVVANRRTDLDWLKKCSETTAIHIQESTNAMKDVAFNPTTAEVKENRKEILRDESGRRIFYDTIGSNALDIEKFCEAAGDIRREAHEKRGTGSIHSSDLPFSHIIFAGAAIRNKYGDMNDSDGFKGMMRRTYGIETMHADSKTAQELLAKGEGSYIVIMTGTQDEPLSLTHRISRDLHDVIRLEANDVIIRGQAPIPGEGRIEIRHEQNNRYRYDFGCTVYDSYEMAQKGKHIYASSHASQDDYRQIHELTGGPLKLLHHGGPAQLNKMMELMKGMGARSMIPDKQAVYLLDRANKSVSVVAQTPEERVGYREIRADQDEFFKKQRQQATIIRVGDRWHGPVADFMYQYENVVEKRADAKVSHAPTNRGANVITDHFNEGAGAADFPKIGILHPAIERPYYEKQRNIHAMIAMDTETTGINPAVDVHTDSSFVAARNDGTPLREKTLRHGLRRYQLASAGALAVTHNGDPRALHKGLSLRKYALRLIETYREWPQKLLKDKDARAVFAGWRNGVFDDHITMRMLGMAVASGDMKPMATNGNLQVDLYNMYTALIALVPDKIGARKDAAGNYIRTLQAACEENGVEYDPAKAHGSLYDAKCTLQLLFKFKEKSPDIFEQMLMNADFSASRRSPMIDHILGQNLSFNDQAPLFGFVDRRDRTCTPRIGALVTIDTVVSKASDAIVIDLAKADIHQLEQLSDSKLLELMNDRQGPFAVMKMNNSPCWFPPQMVWQDPKIRGKAIGKLPKSTLLQRANALKQIRSDGKEIANNFIQRVQKLYPQSRLCYQEKTSGKPANGNTPSKAFRLPNERIFSLFDIIKPVNQIRDRHIKAAAQLLRDIQPSKAEFRRDFNKPVFWKNALARVHALSEETGGRNQYKCIDDLRFLIEWQVYDMNPRWLPDADRIKINALKSAMLHGPDNSNTMTIEKFRKELNDIEKNEEQLAKIVGTGPDAKEKWENLKAMYLGYAESMAENKTFSMTPAKRETVRLFRRNGQTYSYV